LRQEDKGEDAAILPWRWGTVVKKARMMSPGSDRWSKGRETPILNETARNGWAGLRHHYAFAGPDNAVSGSMNAKDLRPRPPLSVGH